MSYQDDIEESLQGLFDEERTYENNSLRTSKPSDSEDNAAADEPSIYLSRRSESPDDTASTSEAVDQSNKEIRIKLPNPRIKVADTAVDFPESSCCCSDSEASYLDASDNTSDMFPFLRRPTGWRGLQVTYVCEVKKLREKGYLLPFEIIGLAFTIACCFMGAYNWPSCPADVYIPRYVFFNGAVGTFSVCVEIMDSVWKLVMRPSAWDPNDYRSYFCAFGFFWVAVITTIVEMFEFYTTSYSFHRSEENYCDETFYWFVYYKNIASGVLMFLTAMIYIPSFDFYYWISYYI